MTKVKTANQWGDFWRHQVGVNVIPALNKTKIPKVAWKKWQTEPILQEIHDEWKKNNAFKDGLAIITGQVFHNKQYEGFWLNAIDCDDKSGVDAICPTGVAHTAKGTLVEQHDNPEKCHVLFYSDKPLKNRILVANAPQVEVKSMGKNLLYCAGGYHKDGSLIDIVETEKIKIVNTDALEKQLDSILGVSSTLISNTSEQLENLSKKKEGSNRQLDLLSLVCKHIAGINKETLEEEDCINKAIQYNNKLAEPYAESRVIEIGKSAYQYRMNDKDFKTKSENNNQRIISEKQQSKLSVKEIVEMVAIQIMQEKEFVTISRTKEILTWDGMIYSNANAEAYIKGRTEQLVYDNSEHISNEVVNKIKRRSYKDIENFDVNPNEITTLGGILNLETLDVLPHTPDNLSLILVPVRYDEPKFPISNDIIFEDIEKNLENTLFWKFITSSFTVDKKIQSEKRETVLEILASIFIKHQIDQRGFIFLGRGDNGKSVFIEYLQMMVGKDNYSNETLHDLSTDRFASASLLGKLLNCFSDIESNELDRVGILKAILAGEWLSAQFKNGQKFKFNPFCKMVFSCNRFPKVSDNTESFFRRWIILKWGRSFEDDPERDEKLVEKLSSDQEELNLVFSTIIYLSRKLFRTRKFTNTKKASDLRIEWNANADPVETFIDTWIITSDNTDDEKGIRDTFAFYKIKTEEAGERPLNIRQFGREFAESFDQLNTHGKRRWVGLKFKEPKQDLLKESDDS